MVLTIARIKEGLKFIIAGGMSFVVDASLLYFLVSVCGINYFFSAAISFASAIVVNYFLCSSWVFCGNVEVRKRKVFAFFLVSFSGLVLNQCCMWALVEILSTGYLSAKIVATVLISLWNYFLKRNVLLNVDYVER